MAEGSIDVAFDFAFDFGVAFEFCSSHVSMPLLQGRKWKKKDRCLSVASFRSFPFFDLQQREPPLGGSDASVAFLAHLFGEAKRWVAAGLPPASNRK
ncbi:hypothetical protein H8L32_24435 [Undibacterium sp. CY18W]|uniref:Uncharacterized protein n=1 Tax=Undibacterium hunanense TaxID=2762292 RepID=A0ABR6ZXQ3_9BURK|nr:hypothetical protein [Undibacterium hunanense]